MKNIQFAIILFLLAACGSPVTVTKRSVAADLEEYVQRFEQIWGRNITFSVQLADVDKQYVGFCEMDYTGARRVKISNLYWGDMTDPDREQTMFHELGHCALNRAHKNDLDSLQRPVSIMYYMEFGFHQYYTDNRAAYVQELFTNGQGQGRSQDLGETVSDFRIVRSLAE